MSRAITYSLTISDTNHLFDNLFDDNLFSFSRSCTFHFSCFSVVDGRWTVDTPCSLALWPQCRAFDSEFPATISAHRTSWLSAFSISDFCLLFVFVRENSKIRGHDLLNVEYFILFRYFPYLFNIDPNNNSSRNGNSRSHSKPTADSFKSTTTSSESSKWKQKY